MKTLSVRAQEIKPSSTLAINALFNSMKAAGKDVVGMGAGEPDFDTPDYIKEAAKSAVDSGKTKYTEASGLLALRTAVCEKFKKENGISYEPSQIVISNGAKHSLYNAFYALINPGDEVLLPAPYWVSYYEMIKMCGGIPVVLPTDAACGYKVSASQIDSACTDKTKLIVLNTPSNPTGVVYGAQELSAIADVIVKNDIYCVSDEIYEHLVYEGKHVSIASFNSEIYERTIVINGVSKSYCMTGWRIGYSASSQMIAKQMGSFQSHNASNPNTIAQHATIAALSSGVKEREMMKAEFARRRDYIVVRASKLPYITYCEPKGAFYLWMDMSALVGRTVYGEKITGAAEFLKILLEKQLVCLVPGDDFGSPTSFRWSYATSKENITKAMDRFEEFLSHIE